MAGMLPGVEAARRRRVHQTGVGVGVGIGIGAAAASSPSCSSSRRPSFSLFCSNSSSSSSSSSASLLQQRSRTQHHADDKLGQVARQAKERLDERLRAQTKSSFLTTPDTSEHNKHIRELRREVYGGGGGRKKSGGWWKKSGWKAVEQRECAVCLEDFKDGEQLVNMPCAHTFHSTCLVPWLHNHAHCPCCRTSLFS